jgi:hypothetical protein
MAEEHEVHTGAAAALKLSVLCARSTVGSPLGIVMPDHLGLMAALAPVLPFSLSTLDSRGPPRARWRSLFSVGLGGDPAVRLPPLVARICLPALVTRYGNPSFASRRSLR